MGRRDGNFLAFGSTRRYGYYFDDAERVDIAETAECLYRLLEFGLPGDRGLTSLSNRAGAGAVEKQGALALVTSERGGALKFGARFVEAVELG